MPAGFLFKASLAARRSSLGLLVIWPQPPAFTVRLGIGSFYYVQALLPIECGWRQWQWDYRELSLRAWYRVKRIGGLDSMDIGEQVWWLAPPALRSIFMRAKLRRNKDRNMSKELPSKAVLSYGDNVSGTGRHFYCEAMFYEMADSLRAQFDKSIQDAASAAAGMTGFSYAFCQGSFQFLTASAERCFSSNSVQNLIERIRLWAGSTLGTTYVSMPHVRVYVRGCHRSLLRDDIAFPWRYCLSLTGSQSKHRIGYMTIAHHVKNTDHEQGNVITSNLDFNQLVVHSTRSAYSLETNAKSMNPVEATVFVDGYLW
jgi:hypothetical protein